MKDTILFLQSEIHNYHISLILELTNTHNYKVVVIYKDKNTKTPYQPPTLDNVEFVGKSQFENATKIIRYVKNLNIALTRVSGWMDKDYVKVARFLTTTNIPVVACSDTQWRNETKQILGTIIFGRYIRNSFTHIMVAGPYQFEYARRLGFKKNRILFNNLSADTNVYNSDDIPSNTKYSKTIIYAGRFSPEKGIDILLDAWRSLDDKNGWKLQLVGNGPISIETSSLHAIENLGFMSNIELFNKMITSGFMILPSLKEQWGVFMHEAALAGLPILCSDGVGAIPLFLIKGYNGYTFKTGNIQDLKQKLLLMINLSDEEILKLKENSKSLGQRITTPISAASLLAALY